MTLTSQETSKGVRRLADWAELLALSPTLARRNDFVSPWDVPKVSTVESAYSDQVGTGPFGPNTRMVRLNGQHHAWRKDSGIGIVVRISGWSRYPVVRLSGLHCSYMKYVGNMTLPSAPSFSSSRSNSMLRHLLFHALLTEKSKMATLFPSNFYTNRLPAVSCDVLGRLL